jgi:hypothetical protein
VGLEYRLDTVEHKTAIGEGIPEIGGREEY